MNVHAIVARIQVFKAAEGLTEQELAQAIGVHQSTISRALSYPKRVTKTHRKICEYAKIPLVKSEVDAAHDRQRLIDGVLAIWDGSSESAGALLELLAAAGAILDSTRRRVSAASKRMR